jgi:hypothetical protein
MFLNRMEVELIVDNECNLLAGVRKVQTFGTTHDLKIGDKVIYN